jgi:putative oxidoreductase
MRRSDAIAGWTWLTAHLRGAGEVVPRLVMRLVMGWEFWESGLEKYHGQNWFADIQQNFPFPFNVIPADISWFIATWFELLGAVALWLGLGTRFVAFSLMFLTFVATAAVHWPDMWSMWSDLLKGYSISDRGYGNFKLPLLFVVLLLPLVFNGPGKFSADHTIALWLRVDDHPRAVSDAWTWSLAALVLGVPMLMLLPATGAALLGVAVVLGALALRGARPARERIAGGAIRG